MLTAMEKVVRQGAKQVRISTYREIFLPSRGGVSFKKDGMPCKFVLNAGTKKILATRQV